MTKKKEPEVKPADSKKPVVKPEAEKTYSEGDKSRPGWKPKGE